MASAKLVKELRDQTGAGMMDCKNALDETGEDLAAAKELLQKRNKAIAMKKSGRIAAEGAVHAYIHGNGRIGVLVEVNCETDFAARNDDFRELVKDVSMHIAAASPQYLSQADVPARDVAKQEEIFAAQVKEAGKPDHIIPRIVEGKIKKWFAEVCLLDQAFVKDTDKSVGQLVTEVTGKIGEKITVRRFTRFQLGEGIEKREEDFAAEVAAQVSGA